MSEIDDIIEAGRGLGLERRVTELEKTFLLVGEIHTALIGTLEKPGLVREIKDHSDFIAGCKRRHDDEQTEKRKEGSSLKVKIIYGALATAGLAIVWLMGRAGII